MLPDPLPGIRVVSGYDHGVRYIVYEIITGKRKRLCYRQSKLGLMGGWMKIIMYDVRLLSKKFFNISDGDGNFSLTFTVIQIY